MGWNHRSDRLTHVIYIDIYTKIFNFSLMYLVLNMSYYICNSSTERKKSQCIFDSKDKKTRLLVPLQNLL